MERPGATSTGETLDASLAGSGDVLGQKLKGRGSRGPVVDEGNGIGGTIICDGKGRPAEAGSARAGLAEYVVVHPGSP